MTKDDTAELVSNDLDPFGEQLFPGQPGIEGTACSYVRCGTGRGRMNDGS